MKTPLWINRRRSRLHRMSRSQAMGCCLGTIITIITTMVMRGVQPAAQFDWNTFSGRPSTRPLEKLQTLSVVVNASLENAYRSNGCHIKHVMVLLGTRPEAIKLAPIIMELKSRPSEFLCTVISTGQHHSMLVQVLDAFGLGGGLIDLSLGLMTDKQSLPALTSRVLTSFDAVISRIRPDLIVVQGDTTTALAGALTAFYHKIPVGHVEAGLRTHDRYSPFPEEVNRQGIGILASLHFAATDMAAENLAREGKDAATIFVTGNPVVDALRRYGSKIASDKDSSSPVITKVEHAAANNCGPSQSCRLILLTAHRRENHGKPLRDILGAVVDILKAHQDVLVAYPTHLNPNVQEAIAASVPQSVYNQLKHGKTDTWPPGPTAASQDQADSQIFSRLLLLRPLDYPDLVRVMNMSHFILTDSGGIQEEGAVLGKPIIVLRDTTERLEGVQAGMARLVGTKADSIVPEVNRLLQNDNRVRTFTDPHVYGDGHAAERIVNLLSWHLNDNNIMDTSTPLAFRAAPPIPSYGANIDGLYDLVVVLTVWKRDTLSMFLEMLAKQTMLNRPGFRTRILVFQNGDHLNVSETLDEWRMHTTDRWGGAVVDVTHIHSLVPTGYYGRFLAPLVAKVRSNGYFIIFDDDVLFGSRYVENMLRVVDKGALAVRVGRFIGDPTDDGQGLVEHMGVSPHGWAVGVQVTYEEDVVYDFGGQVWAGTFDWLRVLWSHPPPVWITSEDFWISAVLQTQLGVVTKRPRCPADDAEQCACSMQVANDHNPIEVGEHRGGEFDVRSQAMGDIARTYGYHPLGGEAKTKEATVYTFHAPNEGPFSTQGTWIGQCLYFI